jgi:ribonuclease-3
VSAPEKLQRVLDYQFNDPGLLTQALTHRSFSDTHNERLEFLGDSILNFVIAEALYQLFPDVTEGDLSRLRAKLVRRQTLAEVAREIELGDYLTMGSGEMKSGGRNRSSTLADALEAVIGAVLIDSDMNRAADLIRTLFQTRLENLSEADLQKDAKTRLQEFLQGRGEPVPDYVLIGSSGKSPNQEFEVEVRSNHLGDPVRAKGSSIRRAEQHGAELALKRLER